MAPRIAKLESSLARSEGKVAVFSLLFKFKFKISILELIAIGQNVTALETLSSVLLGTKYPMNYVVQSNSLATSCAEYVLESDLELMVVKIIELSVELRRGRMLKEVLTHVRLALQAVHTVAFEFILRQLMMVVSKFVNAAKGKLDASVDGLSQKLASVDLEGEVLELEEREILTPWLRFQWECLRIVLDLTRNNSRFEVIYHDTVLEAFDFCRTFSRKAEFRRLSEMIRYHLVLTVRYPNQLNAINLASSADSHKLAMDLRFAQLSLACDMELWQEAFRTIEDIYGLQIVARKSPRLLASPEYFDKLKRIFSKSGNFLFLAATLARSESDHSLMVMAALASPFEASCEETKEQAERLARIIGLSACPSRAQLLAQASERLSSTVPEVSAVFKLIQEQELDCVPGIVALEKLTRSCPEYAMFVRPCYENMVSALINRLRFERDSIKISELKIAAGVEQIRSSGLVQKFNLELFLALGVRNGKFLGVRIDQFAGSVTFDRSLILAEPKTQAGEDASQVWTKLTMKLKTLLGEKAQNVLELAGIESASSFAELLKTEHVANLDRKLFIERRKETLIAEAADKERQEAQEKALREQKEAEAARIKSAEENARREREKLEIERAEIKKQEAEKRLAEQERLKEAAGARLNREKLESQATRLDYLERAARAEEIPLLEADYAKQKVFDREAYETRCSLIRKTAHDKHQHDLEIKKKFSESSDLLADYNAFLSKVTAHRQEQFKAKQAHALALLEEEKQKRRDRIAAELEARRKLEAEREAARLNATASFATLQESSSEPAKYVPPARSCWRREEVPVAAPSVAEPVSEEPKKNVYVPRHKRS